MIRPFLRYQGNKFKLIPFLKERINIKPEQVWVEPFLGSATVLVNFNPEIATCSDSNPDLIDFISNVLRDEKELKKTLTWLEFAANKLARFGADYYYEIRDDFNLQHDTKKFLFLNTTCFNGICRYNSKGEFNAAFNKDAQKLRKALPDWTKKLTEFSKALQGKNWSFKTEKYTSFLKRNCEENTICYLDPPYFDKNCGYYSDWTKEDTLDLLDLVTKLPGEFWLSSSVDTKKSESILDLLHKMEIKYEFFKTQHQYTVGGTGDRRYFTDEILVHFLKG